MRLADFQHKGRIYKGYSEGGIRTSIITPMWNSMFDMGNTNPDQVQYENLFITHPHLDHFSGVPYYVSQRSLRQLSPPKIYVPTFHKEKIKKLLDIYSELEGFSYNYELIGAEVAKAYPIHSQYFVVPYETYHRVPSQGYTVYEKRSKLKSEFQSLNQKEIIELKNNGIEIEDKFEEPVFSFSGDTKIEYVLNHTSVRKSQVLFLECTYLEETRNVDRAREWGHIHLDEIIENADFFENQKIVLIHFSQRYRIHEVIEIVKKKLPESLKDRVHLFLPEKKAPIQRKF